MTLRRVGTWVKGNTHTHTANSDGDSPPEVVVQWYKTHGYSFLVLTDHNKLTDPAPYDADPSDGFVLIPGEEITSDFEKLPVHVSVLGSRDAVGRQTGTSLVDTIQLSIDGGRDAGGLAQVAHPNFGYAFGITELLRTDRYELLEVYNGHPQVHNTGDAGHPPVERMWDALLSAGRTVYAVACDDAHHYKEFAPDRANPGRGWLMVRVEKLDAASVLDSIRSGDFYASTGVELRDYSADNRAIRISIKAAPGMAYVTRFIGQNGRTLSMVEGPAAQYAFTGSPSDAYVRARVTAGNGSVAWTQPVRNPL